MSRREDVDETEYGYRVTPPAGEGETQEPTGLRIEAPFFAPSAFQFWQRTRTHGYEGRDLWDARISRGPRRTLSIVRREPPPSSTVE